MNSFVVGVMLMCVDVCAAANMMGWIVAGDASGWLQLVADDRNFLKLELSEAGCLFLTDTFARYLVL